MTCSADRMPFAMTTGAIALMLMLAVLGLATTHRTRSDIEHQWLPAGFSADQTNRQLGTCLVMLWFTNGIYC